MLPAWSGSSNLAAGPSRSRGDTMEKEPISGSPKFHEIWIEQCEAAEEIKLRYGPRAAFDYVVAEKLLDFADAATRNPEFARELPRFVPRVLGICLQLRKCGHTLAELNTSSGNTTPLSRSAMSSMTRMSSRRSTR
jgi:hypothetical protein